MNYARWLMFAAMMCIAGGVATIWTLTHGQFDKQNPFVEKTADAEVDKIVVPGADGGKTQKDTFVNVVKGAINRTLGILALIALIVLLRWGFQMVTANGDDGQYKTGFTLLKQAAGGLAMIGVARFLVSIIFFVINLVTENAGSDAWTAS